MKRKLTFLAAMLLAAGTAQAHTHLRSSVPADKSKVAAPQALELHFSESARVTALTLQQGSAAPVNLTVPTAAGKDVKVPVKTLAAGDYKVNWRVAGEDGHLMSGSFGFTVDPAALAVASPSDEGKMPMHDHAQMKDAMKEHMKSAPADKGAEAPADVHQH
jgi:copper resistance protein C